MMDSFKLDEPIEVKSSVKVNTDEALNVMDELKRTFNNNVSIMDKLNYDNEMITTIYIVSFLEPRSHDMKVKTALSKFKGKYDSYVDTAEKKKQPNYTMGCFMEKPKSPSFHTLLVSRKTTPTPPPPPDISIFSFTPFNKVAPLANIPISEALLSDTENNEPNKNNISSCASDYDTEAESIASDDECLLQKRENNAKVLFKSYQLSSISIETRAVDEFIKTLKQKFNKFTIDINVVPNNTSKPTGKYSYVNIKSNMVTPEMHDKFVISAMKDNDFNVEHYIKTAKAELSKRAKREKK